MPENTSTLDSPRALDSSRGFVFSNEERKKTSEHWYTQATTAKKQGNYMKAIKCYTEAINIEPKQFKALFNRVFAFDKLGMLDEAIKDYTIAISIKSSSHFAYYNRGITYDKKSEHITAIKDFTDAIKIDPQKLNMKMLLNIILRLLRSILAILKLFLTESIIWEKINKISVVE